MNNRENKEIVGNENYMRKLSDSIKNNFKQYVVLFILILMVVVLSIVKPIFLNTENVANVMRQVSINMVLAMGMTFVILTGGIDLSVGAIVATAGIICGGAMKMGMTIPTAIILGILTGVIFGAINGIVIVGFKLPPFIMTMAMMQMARGVGYLLTNGNPITTFPDAFIEISKGGIGGIIYYPILIMTGVAIISSVLLNLTKWGRYIYAVGGNVEAARVSGININLVTSLVYTYSGLMSGIAAVLLVSRVNAAQPQAGVSYELDAIAAAIIGGTSFSGGIGKIFGTVLGVFLVGIINNGLNLLGINIYWQMIAKGFVIMLAVIIDTMTNKKEQ
ncbi:MAG: ABC transporter permease [Eubacteriales bacterium]|nr:ABC transporter permease [Eubacteriales bacterium]